MYRKFIEDLKKFESLGVEVLDDGTRLIGKAPFIAPLARVHLLYAGIYDGEIDYLESQVGCKFPNSLRLFFQCFNGLMLFNCVSVYGLRKNNERSIDSTWQPFDFIFYNNEEKLPGLPNDMVVIGGYRWNGSKLCLNLKTEEVIFSSTDSYKELMKWSSLEEMLGSELNRLSNRHTKEGKNIPYRPTVPMGGKEELEKRLNKTKRKKPYWYDETIEFMKKNNYSIEGLLNL
ncbi:hypothetical protein PEPS_18730 [Persicobacter psychrovividus]|uniref:Knr4/Smi1-like domain-containing protein n=2 Tax=Persicobacter psychrovividus TaxID=387638 RepID=A0ABM7VF89_9BACT|nr:hypothetical protein PEPS_18730 [Persicobacter psychrovividus]